jgi:hypothetical protein
VITCLAGILAASIGLLRSTPSQHGGRQHGWIA